MAALVVGERFEVHALTGYSIGERSRFTTDYYVLDSWECYREVAACPPRRGKSPERRRREACWRAAELNAWHARELHA